MKSRRIVTLIISFIALLGLAYFVLPDVSFAQQSDLEAIGEVSGLGTESDPRLIVARIIRAILGVMGILAVCIIIYAGFLWMTAGGESERVDKAKRLLINAAIGLVIIFASVAIVQFVIGAIGRATGLGSGSGGSGGDCLDCFGGGADIGFVIEGFRPEGEIPIRNVVARAYFSKLVDEGSLEGALQVLNADTTNEIPVTLAVVGDTLKITPQEACPAPNEDRFCFPENTNISVQFLDGIQSKGGQDLICRDGVYPCSFAFKTGSLVDTEAPDVDITTPFSGERFNKAFPIPVQARATDDAMVSGGEFYADDELFGTEAAVGPDLRDVLLDTAWDAGLYPDNRSYRITAIVYDLADNNSRASLSIRLNPAYCYNNVLDAAEGETDIDCGGACGACDGSSCTEDGDCADGRCLDNKCIAVPEITSFEPSNGAPGTYVTIRGTNFGMVPGTIYFTGDTGLIPVSIPACSDGWDDEVIIVEVPQGAVDGAIVLRASSGVQDSTSDEFGELLTDFDVNDTRRPGLCRVSPNMGQPRTAATLYGNGFGGAQDTGFILFDKDELYTFSAVRPQEYTSWSDAEAGIRVPTLEEDDYLVTLTQSGVTSNPAPYYVRFSTDAAVDTAPRIQSIAPDEGAIGAYVTITGVNFGARIDKVWFENTDDRSLRALGSIDFPSTCTTEDIWRDDQIIIKVPAKYPNQQNVEPGSFDLFVQVGDQETEAVDFEILQGLPGPQVCAIEPREGEAGDKVTLYGENFGSGTGTVIFSREAAATITRWTPGAVDATVPAGETGIVVVRDVSGPRTAPEQGVNFTYGEGAPTDTSVAKVGGYGWLFSTGDIPQTPQIIIACNDTVKSGIPNELFNATVCRNIITSVRFTTGMNPASLRIGQTINIYACQNESCSQRLGPYTDAVLGLIGTQEGGVREIRVRPPSGLAEPNTRYRVEIVGGPSGVLSLDGEPMAQTVGWEFVTGDENDLCTVDEVLVQPSTAVLRAEGAEEAFTAGGYAESCILLSDSFDWEWSARSSVATLDVGGCSLPPGFDQRSCAIAEAVGDGQTEVAAKEPKSAKRDTADLTVSFTDPYIVNTWPSCQGACVNAAVGGSFNVPVQMSGTYSILRTNAIDVYECQDELCLSTVGSAKSVSAECKNVVTVRGTQGCLEFGAAGLTLDPDKFYRVRVDGRVRSLSGKPLTKLTTQTHYVWSFSTSDQACAIDSLLLNPMSPVATQVGDRQSFTAIPLSEPDNCSVAGQRLDASSYDWTWEDPIIAESGVAEWVGAGGSLLDAGEGAVSGCTTNCLPTGSEPARAVCGNGKFEYGEECEDGNGQNGDGCSKYCLREPRSTTFPFVGSCGDGLVQRNVFSSEISPSSGTVPAVYQSSYTNYQDLDGNGSTHGFIGDECDDGNTVSGDGCSATCQNEGSRYVGSACGNGDIAHENNKGGEDCDDSNTRDGDGCSSVCVSEGSASLADQRAICGDGIIQAPYETCDDDGVENGDGCSSSCVREGIRGGAVWQPLCGNRRVDVGPDGAGEDCDGEDGCGVDCLWRGSSLSYSAPSVCGDGIAGFGEYNACEAGGVLGDGRVDPTQVAKIADTAPEQINAGQMSVAGTVRVGQEDYDISVSTSYTLSCGARSDDDCSDPVAYGVGVGGCCMARPVISSHAPQGVNVCRNALPSFTVSTEINTDSARQNVRLVRVGAGACPVDHTVAITSEDMARNPLLAFGRRVWQTIVPVIHAQGECIVPIQGVRQQALAGGSFSVEIFTGTLFAENTTYEFQVLGDDAVAGDAAKGLQSKLGARMLGDYRGVSKQFTTGTQICEVNFVKIEDPEGDPEGFFAVAGEDGARNFTATAYSVHDGVEQQIQETPGYGWTWSGWRSDDTEVVAIGAITENGSVSTARIVPQQDNGQAAVVATLSIDGRTAGSFCVGGVNNGKTCSATPECGVGSVCTPKPVLVTGAQEVETFFCENPWPSTFPYEDAAGNDDGVRVSPQTGEWTDFSTYYCRDNGKEGLAEDLPGLRAIQPPQLPSISGLQKEFFFEVSDPQLRGDVIGIRVISNSGYLSPLEWFSAQKFEGSPSEIEIDGFAAVRDGRTVYVAGARQAEVDDEEQLRSNIYILSYNEGASAVTQEIFKQMLENFELLVNLDNGPGLCESDQTKVCTSNIDCGLGDVCQDVKGKVARDIERITDLNRMARSIEQYAVKNGVCSATEKSCVLNADCPTGEVCRPLVPELATGTFVPGLSASTWPSWQQTLGSQIPGLRIDPINKYGVTTNGQPICSGDPTTCYAESNRTYLCIEDSLVYHFTRDVSGAGLAGKTYQLQGQLEYDGASWEHPIPQYPLGVIQLSTNSGGDLAAGFTRASLMCDGEQRGSSSVCGDGIVGRNETCEPGGPTSTGACELPDGPDADTLPDAGQITTRCKQSCDGYETVPGAVCTALRCGNGVVEAGEQCDDGVDNGRYGFCSTSCSYADAPRCGDSQVDPGEACDCGVSNDGIAGGRTMDGSVCGASDFNGKYAASAAKGCSWDCRGPAAFCGDRVANGAEACDGESESTTQACANGTPCTADSDCSDGSVCGDKKACADARVCQAGDARKIGLRCDAAPDAFGGINVTDNVDENTDCDSVVGGQNQGDGQCSPLPVERGVTRTCGAPGSTGSPLACQYASTWAECLPVTTCGNGAIEAGEECDDGNRENGDACSNVCRFNVCGDGFVFRGVEACDNGERNGQTCDAAYDASCSFCATNCTLSALSGSYCGDGIRQASTELCDAGDVPYNWVTATGENGGVCERAQVTAPARTLPSGASALCRPTGLCSGGDRNGEICVTPTYAIGGYAGLACSGGGTCVLPACNQDCQTACPFNYDSETLKFASQFEGASRDTLVTLTKTDEFDPTDTTDKTRPAARATIYVPACRVAGPILGDVDFNIDRPSKAYVMFVNDLSNSMGLDVDGTGPSTKSRAQVLKLALVDAVSSLFTELGTNVEIGMAIYGGDVVVKQYAGMESLAGKGSDVAQIEGIESGTTYRELLSTDASDDRLKYGQVSDFYTFNQLSMLTSLIQSFDDNGPYTNTSIGLLHALYGYDKYIDSDEEARRIIILMTDGEFTGKYSPGYLGCVAKSRGFEVYTMRVGFDGEVSSLFNPELDETTLQPIDCGDMGGGTNIPNYQTWSTELSGDLRSLCSPLILEEYPSDWGTGEIVSQRLLEALACTSTGNPDNINGLDYAYSGDSEAEFLNAYKQIVATIKGATIEYTVPLPGGGFELVPGEIVEGNGIEIPYPTGFTCNPGEEQLIPITMRFFGSGSVQLSNFRFNYCKP